MEPQTSIQAVLIDTVSIQKYIFASNKLKENLGASYLVQKIYGSVLEDTLKEIFSGQSVDLEKCLQNWKDHPEEILLKQTQNYPFEVGYIGGGNALLLFREEKKARKFVEKWTARLLVETPGITTAVAFLNVNRDELEHHFDDVIKTLHDVLEENQAKYSPQTVLPRHGITAECPRSEQSVEFWNDFVPEEERGYVSSVTYAKLRAAEPAGEELEKKYGDLLKEIYTFTDDIGELGQKHGEDSHIAIVHIDGNAMSQRFQTITSLQEIRKLSKKVQDATENAFRVLLEHITSKDIFDQLAREVHITKKNGKAVLPIRSIILGGDDITFVCDGRLGVYFAKIFMKAITEQGVDGLSTCAGIAIVRTKFPFFRGYELAEQLCKSAKAKWHVKGRKGSWLDFHITYGGFTGKLKDIRRNHYTTLWQNSRGTLLFRPYCVDGNGLYGLSTLIKHANDLRERFPNLKIKELREVLSQGEHAAATFVKDQQYRDRRLPKIDGKQFDTRLFEVRESPYVNMEKSNEPQFETPYFDMIEFLECYPLLALQDAKEVADEKSDN